MTSKIDQNPYRLLPSVDRLLHTAAMVELSKEIGEKRTLAAIRSALDAVRTEMGEGRAFNGPDEVQTEIEGRVRSSLWSQQRSATRKVINATGTIIHTNLGRAPLSAGAIRAIAVNASRYCTLEYNLENGARGRRGEAAERLVCDLAGAEAAVIVNNCAAATFLTLAVLARGKEVIISRGELVEIGGDFRIPDVLRESGAMLREVGTTNRTKITDYERAINEDTGMILRVHPSNYRIIGFTETPSLEAISKLAKKRGIPVFEDAGSGALIDLTQYGLGSEPIIAQSIAAGVDLVAFSGDKLMGGVQAGFVVGRAELVETIRRHPLYRALRLDKIGYGAVEATLNVFAEDRQHAEIPVLRMISMSAEEIRQRSERLVRAVTSERLKLDLIKGESVIGGGAAPQARLPTCLISVSNSFRSAGSIEASLRERAIPVIGRLQDDSLILDLRTVFEDEEVELSAALQEAAS